MKTFSESRGHKPFNWYEALNAEHIDWDNLSLKASSWITCACGNQCDVIPRDAFGMPHDITLQKLGGLNGFYGSILYRDKEGALNTLVLIEKRSAYLIQQINNHES